MAAAKMKVRELFSELLEDARSGSGSPPRPAAARGSMKSLVIELRANVDEAQQPKAQAPLETLAAPGGLIKTFDGYERSEL